MEVLLLHTAAFIPSSTPSEIIIVIRFTIIEVVVGIVIVVLLVDIVVRLRGLRACVRVLCVRLLLVFCVLDKLIEVDALFRRLFVTWRIVRYNVLDYKQG